MKIIQHKMSEFYLPRRTANDKQNGARSIREETCRTVCHGTEAAAA